VTQQSPSTSPFFCKDIDFSSKDFLGARTNQEDYSAFHIGSSGAQLLAVLADGMGGHSGGEIASKKAVDVFISTFKSNNSDSILVKLGASLNQANCEIASTISSSPALDGMGCTLVAMHVGPTGLQWISVGDSPLFLFRDGKLTRLNADHSMTPLIEEAVRLGNLSKEEALKHPDRHALRSAVSGEELAIIDTSLEPLKILRGDLVLLASDGLLSLSNNEISKVLKANLGEGAHTIVSKLIDAVVAKQKPKQDNTTIQLVIAPNSFGRSSSQPLFFWSLIVSFLLVIALVFMGWMGNLSFEFPKTIFENRDASSPPIKPLPTPIASDTPSLPAETKVNEQPVTPSVLPKEIVPEPVAKDSTNKTVGKTKLNAQNEKPAKVGNGNSKTNSTTKVGGGIPNTPGDPALSAPSTAPPIATTPPASAPNVLTPSNSGAGVNPNPTGVAPVVTYPSSNTTTVQQPAPVTLQSSQPPAAISSNPSIKSPGNETTNSRPPVVDANPSPVSSKDKQ
jgi:serine/threonine protein phosphatase PrpC